jgi:hypothetical protein
VRIKHGSYGEETLDDLCVGILLDVPGRMGEGGWTVALYIDDKANNTAFSGLQKIFTGQAGGSLGILSLLIANILGVERAKINFTDTDGGWHMLTTSANRKISDCAVNRLPGQREGEDVVIHNSQYWVAPDVTVAVGSKSRVRAFGRVWDFSGQSAEYATVSWLSDD